jgi:hypothetical protein
MYSVSNYTGLYLGLYVGPQLLSQIQFKYDSNGYECKYFIYSLNMNVNVN